MRTKTDRRVDRRLECLDNRGACFILDMGSDVAAPDYTPVANASKESAAIMAALGQAQLAESQRQYNENMKIADPVIRAQVSSMNETQNQGRELFDYFKSRAVPVEDALRAESLDPANAEQDLQDRMGITESALEAARIRGNNAADLRDRTSTFEGQQAGDTALYTGGNQGIQDRYQNDINADIGNAVADTRAGQTSAMGQAARTAMRYGMSPAAIAGQMGTLGATQAQQIAAAANGTRNASTDKYRALVGQGIGLRQDTFNVGQGAMSNAMDREASAYDAVTNAGATSRDMRLADDSRNWAKKLDVSGMYRNMPGLSQGAYNSSTSSGTNAVNNRLSTGSALTQGMSSAAGTIGSGQQMALGGLGSILSSQTSAYNAGQSGDSFGSLLGGIGGAAAGLAKTGIFAAASDRRLKENITMVGIDEATGLALYEFNYINAPEQRWRGVMADEVERIDPEAVTHDDRGFAMVNYAKIGITMEAV